MQWVNGLACLCGGTRSILGLVQWIKNLELLQLWHRSHLWLGFDPWPRNFHVPRRQLKKKKNNKNCLPLQGSILYFMHLKSIILRLLRGPWHDRG